MISLATKYPNVYIDTSAYKASRYPREFVDYLRGHGRNEVLFGSNHPAWPAADCLGDFARLHLDDETANLFLHGNAEQVFGLNAGAPRNRKSWSKALMTVIVRETARYCSSVTTAMACT